LQSLYGDYSSKGISFTGIFPNESLSTSESRQAFATKYKLKFPLIGDPQHSLTNQLNAQISHWGEPGRSIWTTFFKFNQLNKANRLPDICVLCYTEPYRLYHPSLILSANTKPVEGVDTKIYEALEQYWIHLHNYDKDELSYEYAVKWFDHDVLSKIKNKTIVQTR
jgi:hypothetical protein